MKFRPLHDRVVVKRTQEDERTADGIVIPDTAKGRPMQGEVVANVPGARDRSGEIVPLGVEVGDGVLLGKFSGSEVTIENEDYVIIAESDIPGVCEGSVAVGAAA